MGFWVFVGGGGWGKMGYNDKYYHRIYDSDAQRGITLERYSDNKIK